MSSSGRYDAEVYRKFRERVARLVNEEREKQGANAIHAKVQPPSDYDLDFMKRWLALQGLKIVSGLTHFTCSCAVPHVVVCDQTIPPHIHCSNCHWPADRSLNETGDCLLCSSRTE